MTAGDGLNGGGTIAATRTFSVDSGSILPYYSSSIFGTVSGDITITNGGVATVGDGIFSGSAQVDHDSTTNFEPNEHIDHSGVSITAGAGLTGGGTIASTRDIAVGAGTGVTVNTNDVAIGQDVATTANVLFNHVTASGNISASGNLYADLADNSGAFKTVMYDTTTGKFYRTGSYSAGGGGGGGGDVTGITAGDGIRVDNGSTATPDVHIDFGENTTNLEGTAIASADVLLYMDSNNSDDMARGLVSDLPFTNTAGTVTSVNANYGLDITAGSTTVNPTVGLDSDEFLEITTFDHAGSSISTEDSFVVHDRSATQYQRLKRILAENIPISSFNNDSGFASGDITGVTAGTGLSGGGSGPGSVSLAFDPDGTNNGIITSKGNNNGYTVESNITAFKNSSDEGILQIHNTSLLYDPLYNIKASTQHYLDIKPGDTTASGGGTHDGQGLRVHGQIAIMDPGNAASVSTNAGRGHLLAQGDVVAYLSSDKRLKDNITPIKSPLKKLLKIGGYNFEWNDKGPDWVKDEYFGNPSGSLKDVGVIAQEIQPILPEAVKQRKDGYLSVKYEKIIPLLIEAVKEQQTQIEELKTQINQLNK